MLPASFPSRLIELDETDSTNSTLERLARRQHLPEGTVVTARYQSEGRGQATNSWFSDPGCNLLFSILLRPLFLEPRHQFFLNQAIALAVADTVSHFLPGHDVAVKWPNDVLLNEKKVAGLLLEAQLEGNRFRQAIAGIGLNVNQPKFPPSLPWATSFFLESDRLFDLTDVLAFLLQQVGQYYELLRQNRQEEVGKLYMKKLYGIDRQIRFRTGTRRFGGKIAGLSAEGKLIIDTGQAHEVFGFREVEFLRT
ncbi:MAG: biotin--[acetyl-CoA-carboxylase] ligase [Chitinophagales bacterium]|nr:biotin--[acetyl-CoA-carboxylase] ligase [Chitinophagales bacterium]MDW8393046.1 biotin--[acetyl-CoA-carboxylase] ligase [Chitinophagales bacterium]